MAQARSAGLPGPRSCCSGHVRPSPASIPSRYAPHAAGGAWRPCCSRPRKRRRSRATVASAARGAPHQSRGDLALSQERLPRIRPARAYYENGGDALRFEKRLVAARRAAGRPPYFHQTTDFTCGPACIMMALAWADRAFKPAPALEFPLWREATTIFSGAGPGGCEPYGMAVTLKRHGLRPEVYVSRPGAVFSRYCEAPPTSVASWRSRKARTDGKPGPRHPHPP